MKRIIFLLPLILLLAAALHLYLSYRQYNVILITVDTFRQDHSSCYNSNASLTPNIDRIAEHGVMFRNAFSLIPITVPAHSAIMTSRPPHELDLFNNGDIFKDKIPVLSEVLRNEGYQTAAFVSMVVLKGKFGMNRGFQTYDDEIGMFHRRYRLASETTAVVLPWIEAHQKRPFFTWIHYGDPHEPYVRADAPADTEVFINGQPYKKFCLAKKEINTIEFDAQPAQNQVEFRFLGQIPKEGRISECLRITLVKPTRNADLVFGEEWKELKRGKNIEGHYFLNRGSLSITNKDSLPQQVEIHFLARGRIFQPVATVRENYAAEVQFIDQHIGILWSKLSELGLLEKTILIFTADHGELLGEHHRIGHLFPLRKELLQVPLIICYPGLGKQGKTIEQVVNHLDIMPIVLDLLHIDNTEEMRGKSLKHYLSRSPVDWLFAPGLHRSRIFFYTYAPQGRDNSFSVLEGNLKLIQTRSKNSWNWEVYDVLRDPAEQNNLVANQTPPFKDTSISSLRSFLEDQSREAEEAHGRHRKPTLSEEEKEMLRDLGYIAN